MLIKSKPVIRYNATLTPTVEELSLSTKVFWVEICLSYSGVESIPTKQVETRFELALDKRLQLNRPADIPRIFVLTFQTLLCRNISVTLKVTSFLLCSGTFCIIF